MAHLWCATLDQSWTAVPLSELRVPLASLLPSAPAGSLVQAADGSWVVFASPDVRINAVPLHAGMRVLVDRDEIVCGADRGFFSNEQLAAVVPFPASEQGMRCPRCKQELLDSHAVRCPQCGVWHHQHEALTCWTYADTCALCDHPSTLGGTYRWSPEEL